MRLATTTFCLVGWAILGCAGLGEDKGDTASSSGDTGALGESWDQTTSCEEYLDCLAAAEPDELGDAEERYGQSGSCWGPDEDEARACDDACEDLYDALADDHPDEPACGGSADTGVDDTDDTGNPDDTDDTGKPEDTGDTGKPEDTGDTGDPEDTGSGSACALDEGNWSFTLSWTYDECGIADFGSSLEGEVTCTNDARGDMTLNGTFAGMIGFTSTCSSSGRTFSCTGSDSMGFGLSLQVDGTASSAGDTASGTLAIDAGCRSEADVSGAHD